MVQRELPCRDSSTGLTVFTSRVCGGLEELEPWVWKASQVVVPQSSEPCFKYLYLCVCPTEDVVDRVVWLLFVNLIHTIRVSFEEGTVIENCLHQLDLWGVCWGIQCSTRHHCPSGDVPKPLSYPRVCRLPTPHAGCPCQPLALTLSPRSPHSHPCPCKAGSLHCLPLWLNLPNLFCSSVPPSSDNVVVSSVVI